MTSSVQLPEKSVRGVRSAARTSFCPRKSTVIASAFGIAFLALCGMPKDALDHAASFAPSFESTGGRLLMLCRIKGFSTHLRERSFNFWPPHLRRQAKCWHPTATSWQRHQKGCSVA
ncbi:hypothetical protein BDZ85DRAFT_41806 [Elsinoe ampelina]|uniref:Uncharacterized protein n=1 Tax=Elsinoe ampelina TaxID=302913 RepID=A0A6A6G1J9_9PEZI|nr:hypothetical protein BDZ85DRAFT_41806 [Elsinoe ampelina]